MYVLNLSDRLRRLVSHIVVVGLEVFDQQSDRTVRNHVLALATRTRRLEGTGTAGAGRRGKAKQINDNARNAQSENIETNGVRPLFEHSVVAEC